MKLFFTACLLYLFVISILVSSGQVFAQEQYQLVWADEFNNDGKPNPDNWNYEKGFVRNEELQWYQDDNAYCKNGILVIEARQEERPNPLYDSTSTAWRLNRQFSKYTSSSLLTRGLHDWLFGRFEMRAKIDTRAGLWPAFWTLGVKGSWPHNGEIDIMEYYKNQLLANVAWGGEKKWQPKWDTFILPLDSLEDNQWSEKFHIWRMDWNQDSIKLYLDDKLLNETDLTTTINKDSLGLNPFHQAHYIIINLAVGGTAGGDPSTTTFPAKYEIDYVRVYQKE